MYSLLNLPKVDDQDLPDSDLQEHAVYSVEVILIA